MSFFRINASSGNEAKSATLGSVSRQDVIHDTNKRRTLLQDKSWIKKQPTQEEDSDKSEYENKRQSWTPGSRTTATTTSTEDKRKSWTPMNKSTITTTETKKTDELDKLIDIKSSAINEKSRTEELDKLIDIKSSAIKSNPRTDELENLIDIKQSAIKAKPRMDDLNNLIDIKPSAVKGKNRDQGLDDLIAGDTNKGMVKPTSTNTSNVTSRSSPTSYVFTEDNQSAPSRNSTTIYTVAEDNVPNRRSTTPTRVTESTDAGSRSSASYNVSDNADEPNRRSNVSNTQETSYSSSPTNTHVYKTSFEDSRDPAVHRSYQSNSAANSIKTVYSTSDRSVIEKDMCTYCRKPLGVDAKMILKDLSMCCHASCFKCEVCKGDLGSMRAGDSMWIYKQAIHCEPCYFAAREKWII